MVWPPNGSNFERRTATNRNRFTKPFAVFVAVSSARSSSPVICPMTQICAPVVVTGPRFVSVRRAFESQPSRVVAERVLPSLRAARSALAGRF